MADQVVAVQLTDSKGGGRSTSYSSSNTTAYNTYNFIQGRKKANSEWTAFNRVSAADRLVVIDSELVESYYRLKERNRLILPRPVAALLATICELY